MVVTVVEDLVFVLLWFPKRKFLDFFLLRSKLWLKVLDMFRRSGCLLPVSLKQGDEEVVPLITSHRVRVPTVG